MYIHTSIPKTPIKFKIMIVRTAYIASLEVDFTHLFVAVYHATAIMRLITTSTGMISATTSPWIIIVLRTPFPP